MKINTLELHGIEVNKEKAQESIERISAQLSQLEDAKQLEQKRKGLEKDLEKAKKDFEQNTDMFFKRLINGYALVTDQLANDVKQSIENIDVPSGLTVEAVKSILKRPKCICGCDMTTDVVKRLNEMIQTLPPDNISSTILYMANQFEGEKKRSKDYLKEAYQAMKDKENEVADIKKKLSEISNTLATNVSETVGQLEIERDKINQVIGRLQQSEERCKLEIVRANKSLTEKKKELGEASGNQDRIEELNAQQDVLELYKCAIDKIGDRNSELSLLSINEYLSQAYSILSEDIGRRIYICQYENSDKYRLVTYVKSKYDELKSRWINSGKIRSLENDGVTEEEINEKLILSVAEGKSTGQSKVNSLAFAKAILDYSNEDRSDDRLTVSHDYPFLIDSPFTELSGKNLENVASHIHTFANQIILMADDKSYGGIESYVNPWVNTTTKLLKDEKESVTYVKSK